MTRKSKPPIALYSALADATRCRIVEILMAGPIPVHTLADAFSISRPAISRHLRVLKTAGLVAEVKKGRENLYTLRSAKLNPAVTWINTVLSPAEAGGEDTHAPAPAPATADIAPPTPVAAVEPMVVVVLSPTMPEPAEPVAAKPQKAVRVPKAEPAVNQMGFDF